LHGRSTRKSLFSKPKAGDGQNYGMMSQNYRYCPTFLKEKGLTKSRRSTSDLGEHLSAENLIELLQQQFLD